jgi:hypothetical protein
VAKRKFGGKNGNKIAKVFETIKLNKSLMPRI